MKKVRDCDIYELFLHKRGFLHFSLIRALSWLSCPILSVNREKLER